MALNPNDPLGKILHEVIQKRIADVMEEEIKDLSVRIEKRVRREVPSILTEVFQSYSFERYGDTLKIMVDIKAPEKKCV